MPVIDTSPKQELWISHPNGKPYVEEIADDDRINRLPTFTIRIAGDLGVPFQLRIGQQGFPDGLAVVTMNGDKDRIYFDLQPDLLLIYSPRQLTSSFWTLTAPEWKFGSIDFMPVWLYPRKLGSGFQGPGRLIIFDFAVKPSFWNQLISDDRLVELFSDISLQSKKETTADKAIPAQADPATPGQRIADTEQTSNTAGESSSAFNFDPLSAARRARELRGGHRARASQNGPKRQHPVRGTKRDAAGHRRLGRPLQHSTTTSKPKSESKSMPQRSMTSKLEGESSSTPIAQNGDTNIAPPPSSPLTSAPSDSSDDDDDFDDDVPLQELVTLKLTDERKDRPQIRNDEHVLRDDLDLLLADSGYGAFVWEVGGRRSKRHLAPLKKDKPHPHLYNDEPAHLLQTIWDQPTSLLVDTVRVVNDATSDKRFRDALTKEWEMIKRGMPIDEEDGWQTDEEGHQDDEEAEEEEEEIPSEEIPEWIRWITGRDASPKRQVTPPAPASSTICRARMATASKKKPESLLDRTKIEFVNATLEQLWQLATMDRRGEEHRLKKKRTGTRKARWNLKFTAKGGWQKGRGRA